MIPYIIIIILLLLCIFAFTNRKKVNKSIDDKNIELLKKQNELTETIERLKGEKEDIDADISEINKVISEKTTITRNLVHECTVLDERVNNLKTQETEANKRIAELGSTTEELVRSQKDLAAATIKEIKENLEKDTEKLQEDFQRYSAELENKKKFLKNDYDEYENLLQAAYGDKQKGLIKDTAAINNELLEAKKARAALIEANRREREIMENSSFYCIEVSDEDKADISRLENIKKTLNKQRILSMLIWQSYYQKPLKTLSAQVLGAKTVTGIYKITNIVTGECYIGQAVDLAARWVDHVKAGTGIDTPASNKLYKAMQEYGVYNFAFECLEECDRIKLDERERYYIEFYDSYNFGYNSTRGNK